MSCDPGEDVHDDSCNCDLNEIEYRRAESRRVEYQIDQRRGK